MVDKYAVVSPGRCASVATHRLLTDIGLNVIHAHPYNPTFSEAIESRIIILVERKRHDLNWLFSHLYSQEIFDEPKDWAGPWDDLSTADLRARALKSHWPVTIDMSRVQWLYAALKQYLLFKEVANIEHLFYFEDIISTKGQCVSNLFGSNLEIRTAPVPKIDSYENLFNNYHTVVKWWEYLTNGTK